MSVLFPFSKQLQKQESTQEGQNSSHPGHLLFDLLPSSRHYWSNKANAGSFGFCFFLIQVHIVQNKCGNKCILRIALKLDRTELDGKKNCELIHIK